MDGDRAHVEGERLTGLLSAGPIIARGALQDGRRWTLRADTAGRVGDGSVPRVVVALDEGVGHSLVSLAPDPADAQLTARWSSRPNDVEGPGAVALVAACVEEVRHVDGTTTVGELVYRDPDSGWAVFLLEPGRRGGAVVGSGRGGAQVAQLEMQPSWLAWVARAEVPPAVGAGFVAAAALLGAAAFGLAILGGPTHRIKIVVVIVGLLALLMIPARRAWASHRGHPAMRGPRPTHALLAEGIAIVAVACWMWVLGRGTDPWPYLVGGVSVGGLVAVSGYRRDRRPVPGLGTADTSSPRGG